MGSPVSTVGYRSIATKPVLVWAVAATAGKIPIAMAPLAFVFLGRELPGGYSLGASLAAVWVVAEVVGALVLGLWFDPERAKTQLWLGLGLGVLSYAGLAFGTVLPLPVVFVLAFLAGFGPAASPAGLRTLLTGLVPERDSAKVLSAEVVLGGAAWALAPALVAAGALGLGPGIPLACCAVLNLVTMSLIAFFPPGRPAETARPPRAAMGKALVAAWPIYCTAAASMAMVSAVELVLPALLEARGLPVGTVAPLLVAFWVSSMAGGYLYGRRPWPGDPRWQSLICLLVTIAAMSTVAVLPWALGIGIALAVGGAFQSAVLVTRNLSLRARLPPPAHTAGYAIVYSATGIGYSIVAAATALAMTYASPTAAIIGGGVITTAIVAVSGLAELRPYGRLRG